MTEPVARARSSGERRLSTPLVLSLVSGMLAVALVVWLGTLADEPAPAREDASAFVIDDSTPERTAQSFYDAWRRRRWDRAAEVSVGRAHQQVLDKQARDQALPAEERIVAERMWDALARAPLTLALDEAEMLPQGRLRLRGTAEYSLVNRPYRRRVEFVVVPAGGRHRVSEMQLGEVLTELPDMLRGAGNEESP